jgi:capsular exopolysaccharide synthesis family protein
MSMLKTALEKAKAERSLNDELTGKDPLLAGDASTPVRPASEERNKCIEYTCTSVLDVSEEVLLGNRIVAVRDDHPATDRFKLLRTHVFQKTRPNGWNTIQVSGFETGEGKSIVAVNLAVSIANDTRQTTLLVDLDFRNPSLHKLFGLGDKTRGLKSYFLDDAPLEELFVCPGVKSLTLLPAGGRIPNATEILGSPKMEALVNELKQRYDDRYIVLDTPGIGVCPDPLVIAEYVDCILLVARMGRTSKDAILAAMERVPRAKVLGMVINDNGVDGAEY